MQDFKRRVSAGVLGLTCGLLPAGAWAAASSSATASNLSFSLIDLDPTDDASPGYALSPMASTAMLRVHAGDSDGAQSGAAPAQGAADWRLQTDIGGGAVLASWSDGVLSASGSALGSSRTDYSAAGALGVFTPTTGPLAIDLTPHSLLLVSVWADASASVGQLGCPAVIDLGDYEPCETQSAGAHVGLTLDYAYSTDSATASASEHAFVDVGGAIVPRAVTVPGPGALKPLIWQVGPDVLQHEARQLTVTFANTSDLTQRAFLGLNVSALGIGMSAVPEPTTALTMGLGLLGLLAVSRRRQRQV